MQSKPKSNSVVTHERLESGILRFKVLGAGHTDFDKTKASQDNRLYAEDHGWIQRMSDGAAISRDPETGKPATPAEKLAAITELVEYYHTGTVEWSRVGTGGGPRGGFLFEALVRMYPSKSADEVRAWLDGQSKSAQAALRANPKVSAIISVLRDERMIGTDVDTDKLLSELS